MYDIINHWHQTSTLNAHRQFTAALNAARWIAVRFPYIDLHIYVYIYTHIYMTSSGTGTRPLRSTPMSRP